MSANPISPTENSVFVPGLLGDCCENLGIAWLLSLIRKPEDLTRIDADEVPGTNKGKLTTTLPTIIGRDSETTPKEPQLYEESAPTKWI